MAVVLLMRMISKDLGGRGHISYSCELATERSLSKDNRSPLI